MWRFRLASVAIAALVVAGPAAANVGVTSATAGDPLGQPPAQQERVLRVGIDVQARERVTTGADDRAHLVFLDGTALTVGPNSSLTIDKYVFDPAGRTGEVVLGATKGVFRLVGGAISKTGEMKVVTPSATVGIRGGIATIAVSDRGATTATFLHGKSMTVSGQGQSQIATRSGSLIQIDSGRAPTPPTVVPPRGEIAGAIIEKPAVAVAVVATPRPPLAPVAVAPEIRTVAVLPPVVTPAIAPVVPVTAVDIDKALDVAQLSPINSRLPVAVLADPAVGRGQGQGQGRGDQGERGPKDGKVGPAKGSAPIIPSVFRPNNAANKEVVRTQAIKTANDDASFAVGGVSRSNNSGGNNSRNSRNIRNNRKK